LKQHFKGEIKLSFFNITNHPFGLFQKNTPMST